MHACLRLSRARGLSHSNRINLPESLFVCDYSGCYMSTGSPDCSISNFQCGHHHVDCFHIFFVTSGRQEYSLDSVGQTREGKHLFKFKVKEVHFLLKTASVMIWGYQRGNDHERKMLSFNDHLGCNCLFVFSSTKASILLWIQCLVCKILFTS